MKTPPVFPRNLMTALAAFGIGFFLNTGVCRADSPDDEQGTQVLTRGPVHEAFAAVISFKPQAGVVVPKAPPEIIEEVPPDQKPDGDNVTWIPGYWAWDDERNDFLWVSGVWRALPPGRQWVAGYWAKASGGYQWISGYWADADETQATYLPQPPATLENGPDVEAPADDYVWIPGCWIWVHGRYAWKPGYWIEGQADWDWSPDYYVWTPRGCVFVDGYWDYSIERRGVLFAPVYFESGMYARPGYRYSPAIAIDLRILPNHLFVRPRYHHYYFGDYYDASYSSQGFYAAFSFQSGGRGYDPIYAHQHWEHRQDPKWESRVETKYQDRRDHKNTRPPRTWVSQKGAAQAQDVKTGENRPVATSFAQLSKEPDNPRQFRSVAPDEQQRFVQRGQDVKKSRDGRRTMEANSMSPQAATPGQSFKPFSVARPQSPIVSRPAALRGREQAPPRPHNRAPEPRNNDKHDR